MKTVLKVLAGIVVLLLLVGAGGYLWTGYKAKAQLARTMSFPLETVTLATDAATVARGKHLVDAVVWCSDCHGEDLGGQVLLNDPAMGRIVSPNLTRGKGGLGAVASEAHMARTIRHSVGHTDRQLLVMPAWPELSAEDLNAVLAYVRSRPPVDREQPPMALGPVMKFLVATGLSPFFQSDEVDHKMKPLTPSAPAPTKEYGQYLAQVSLCTHCHGPTLSGGPVAGGDPSWPPASNLTPAGLKGYDEQKFMATLRTGVRPSGVMLNDAMPFRNIQKMTDVELKALWAYLQSVPAKEFGRH
jgi:mono/diheme cytochrome c family protein